MNRSQLRIVASHVKAQHVVDEHGQRHYFVDAPRATVSARIAEPLRDHILRRLLGGQHHAAGALTEILWTKLFEFIIALDLPDYNTNPKNYDLLRRKLSLARLTITTRLHGDANSDTARREPDGP